MVTGNSVTAQDHEAIPQMCYQHNGATEVVGGLQSQEQVLKMLHIDVANDG
jgi:hypothetical protein